MKITIKRETYEDVNLTKEEMHQVTLQYLSDVFNFKLIEVTGTRHFGCHINKKGEVITEWEECGGSHCWSENKVIRKATDEDRALEVVVKELREYYNAK